MEGEELASFVSVPALRLFLVLKRHSGTTQSRKASAWRRIQGRSFASRFLSTITIVREAGRSRRCDKMLSKARTRGENSLAGGNGSSTRRDAREEETCWRRSEWGDVEGRVEEKSLTKESMRRLHPSRPSSCGKVNQSTQRR